jgi:phosphatidylserine/phosphatidylglycerophosphate/cardiolipin synthase-like enzyme
MKIIRFIALVAFVTILLGSSWDNGTKTIYSVKVRLASAYQDIQEVDYINDADKGFSKLERLIEESEYNIYISMYTLTNNKLIEKLRNPKHPSRQTFIILDYNEVQKCNDYKKLIGVKNVYIKYKRRLTQKGKTDTYYKFHKKVGIFDGKAIFIGSSNWTEYGFEVNDEQNIMIKSKTTATKAKDDFLKEWKTLK